jgi:hypothetical protein
MSNQFYNPGQKFESMQKNGKWKEVTLTIDLTGKFYLKFANGDLTKEYSQEDLAMRIVKGTLRPIQDTKLPSKEGLQNARVELKSMRKKNCNHANKRFIQYATFSYWFCPDCKEEVQ